MTWHLFLYLLVLSQLESLSTREIAVGYLRLLWNKPLNDAGGELGWLVKIIYVERIQAEIDIYAATSELERSKKFRENLMSITLPARFDAESGKSGNELRLETFATFK